MTTATEQRSALHLVPRLTEIEPFRKGGREWYESGYPGSSGTAVLGLGPPNGLIYLWVAGIDSTYNYRRFIAGFTHERDRHALSLYLPDALWIEINWGMVVSALRKQGLVLDFTSRLWAIEHGLPQPEEL